MSIHSILAGQGQVIPNPPSASAYAGTFGPTGSGAYVNTPNSSSLTIGTTADFTIEFWLYATATASYRCPLCFNVGGNIVLRLDSAWTSSVLSVPFTTFAAPALNEWYHYSVSRRSGTAYVHINGTQYASAASSYNVNLTNARVGDYNNNTNQEWLGYLSQLRVSNIGRYTTNFNPQIILSSDSNTLLLTLDSSTFIDNGPLNLGSLSINAGTNTPTMISTTISK